MKIGQYLKVAYLNTLHVMKFDGLFMDHPQGLICAAKKENCNK